MSTKKPEHKAPDMNLEAAPPLLPDDVHPAEVPKGLSRRAILGMGTAAAVAGAVGGAVFGGAGSSASAAGAARASRTDLTGTIADVKHVVVLMQENRSFDHYYGSLAGVRGFGDRQVLEYPDGSTIFQQPYAERPDGGVLMPFVLDSSKYNAQNAGGLDHSWEGGHAAWNRGAWNRWVAAKGDQTMGTFTREEIPFQYALADAFTIGDHYFCSLNGPTTPNRIFQWSGTNNPQGGLGGPAIGNPADYKPVYHWSTYPEQLQKAGVTWNTYANDEVGDGSGADGYLGDYGDNPLWLFQAYHDSLASSDPKVHDLSDNGGLHGGTWKASSGKGLDIHHVLSEFEAECAAGTLPQVSFVVAPYGWSEHPSASPDYGAHYQNTVVQALFSNPEIWESTVLIINYDENDGYFDHVLPPLPEEGTPNEFVKGLPVGYGTRVPLTVVSPWSRGGWVNSQVFDHTSIIRFIEAWTGVTETNISDWRRQISGDLTSCFDFANPDFSIPTWPDTTALIAAANADKGKPTVQPPAVGKQAMPVQETTPRRHRPIPYQQNANVAVDRSTGAVSVQMTNEGASAVSMAVYPNAYFPFQATPFTVSKANAKSFDWDAAATDGNYDVSVYGPNRFLRRFAGRVVSGSHTDVPLPSVTAKVIGGANRALRLTLSNEGSVEVLFTLASNDFIDKNTQLWVGAGSSEGLDWDLSDGYYDVVVTANTGTGFRYRFAGHIE